MREWLNFVPTVLCGWLLPVITLNQPVNNYVCD